MCDFDRDTYKSCRLFRGHPEDAVLIVLLLLTTLWVFSVLYVIGG